MPSLDVKYDGAYIAWAAFLAGACIGASIALLVAPQTGSQLRTRLRSYASKTRDEVMKRGRETWDAAEEGAARYINLGKGALKAAEREGQEPMEKGAEPQRSHAVHG